MAARNLIVRIIVIDVVIAMVIVAFHIEVGQN
jgi:hypothetical protein